MLGGRLGSVRYSLMFTIVGTTVDYATLKLKPTLRSYKESIIEGSSSWMKLPEWSPIQVLDEEALAAKQAREQQLYAQRALGQLNKKDPWDILFFPLIKEERIWSFFCLFFFFFCTIWQRLTIINKRADSWHFYFSSCRFCILRLFLVLYKFSVQYKCC